MKWYVFIIYFILGIPILINSLKDIFILGITCDGIYSGLYFLYKYFNKDLTENQIITSVSDIYKRGYIFAVDSNGRHAYSLNPSLSNYAGGTTPKFLVGAPNHFYFGTIQGETALDKFKTKYSVGE